MVKHRQEKHLQLELIIQLALLKTKWDLFLEHVTTLCLALRYAFLPVLTKFKQEKKRIHLEASFIEIYQEKVQDLLSKNSELTIREDKKGNVNVHKSSKIPINSMTDVFK